LTAKHIILASSSRYRRELLKRLGLPFKAWSPELDEHAFAGESPRQTAMRLARAKAHAGLGPWPQAWIIGCDQVADLDGEAIGKPGSLAKARQQLRKLSGKSVLFHTALCLAHAEPTRSHERLVTTEVRYRVLSAREIDRYLAREPAFDCAGSAKSEGLGIALLECCLGEDPSALVGLPLMALAQLLRAEGFELP